MLRSKSNLAESSASETENPTPCNYGKEANMLIGLIKVDYAVLKCYVEITYMHLDHVEKLLHTILQF